MEDLGVQQFEEFWGVALSSQKKSLDWEGEDDIDDTFSDINVEKTLELRQACLGANAKPNERNIVQITTENDMGDSVTHTILSLKVGGTEQSALFLTLHPPVNFELVSGSGPVHIVGSVNETMAPYMSSSDEDSDEGNEITSPEVKALLSAASKKRPATSPAKSTAKVAKLDTTEDAEEDEDEDNEMDTSSEKVKAVKKRKVEEDENDEEDSEEDEEEDEEDESDEEDEKEEDSEEEEETLPPVKKPQANGKLKTRAGKQAAKNMLKSVGFKTPQPGKSSMKLAQKGSQSAPTTPKQRVDKKKGAMKGGDALSLDEVKQKIMKLGTNVPKKLDKFNNFVSNSFKIKDESVKKQLWEFVQKIRTPK